jgi:hypothetical protein
LLRGVETLHYFGQFVSHGSDQFRGRFSADGFPENQCLVTFDAKASDIRFQKDLSPTTDPSFPQQVFQLPGGNRR